jgi:hypothetical protein
MCKYHYSQFDTAEQGRVIRVSMFWEWFVLVGANLGAKRYVTDACYAVQCAGKRPEIKGNREEFEVFHAGDRGANPLGDATIKQGLRKSEPLFVFKTTFPCLSFLIYGELIWPLAPSQCRHQ